MQFFYVLTVNYTADADLELTFIDDLGQEFDVFGDNHPSAVPSDDATGGCNVTSTESWTFTLIPGRSDVRAFITPFSSDSADSCPTASSANLSAHAWGVEVAAASCAPCDLEAIEVLSLDTSNITFPCPGTPPPVPTAEIFEDYFSYDYTPPSDYDYSGPAYLDDEIIPTVSAVCGEVASGCVPAGEQCGNSQQCCVGSHQCLGGICTPPACASVNQTELGEGCACTVGMEQCRAPLECTPSGPTANTCQVRIHS